MHRRFRIVALCFWPGLAQIWLGQEVLGLILAALFASTLNLAIVARWIWIDAFDPGWSEFLGILALVSWLASFGYTVWWVGLCHPARHRHEIDKLFRQAHESYLQGRWSDSRRRLEQILARDESDADALMQLGNSVSSHRAADFGSSYVSAMLTIKWRREVALGDRASLGPTR